MIRIGSSKKEENPLQLLNDCHRRIERFLYVLITIVRQAHGATLTVQQRKAMAVALRYFREAAPKHTKDEEDSLFPRMRARATVDQLDLLERDHTYVEGSHQIVEELSNEWLKQNTLSIEDSIRLGDALARLSRMYHQHSDRRKGNFPSGLQDSSG